MQIPVLLFIAWQLKTDFRSHERGRHLDSVFPPGGPGILLSQPNFKTMEKDIKILSRTGAVVVCTLVTTIIAAVVVIVSKIGSSQLYQNLLSWQSL
jgi:hypothetical protein